jgi:hypothetical protein
MDELAVFLSTCDLSTLPGEALAQQILVFLGRVRTRVAAGGETAYLSRRIALFLVETLSLGLRKGHDPEDVPFEAASILDATYQKIQATSSGLTGEEPDVARINQQVEESQKFYQEALAEAGLLKRVPTASGERKIVIAGG